MVDGQTEEVSWSDLHTTRRHELTLARSDGSTFASEVSVHLVQDIAILRLGDLDQLPTEVPVVLGDSARALAASALLEDEGFLVTAIRPPTVPDGTARLRFTFCAAHKDRDVVSLAEIVRSRVLDG